MKTKTYIPTLILTLSLMFAINSFALNGEIDHEAENHINDIPFNTAWVVSEMQLDAIDFEDEAYVDDIPFSTAYVAATAIVYEMEAETYVDDIPFSTTYVAATASEFKLADEAYVDDIPFDTETIATNCLKMEKGAIYALSN